MYARAVNVQFQPGKVDIHNLSTKEVGGMAKSLVAAKLLEFGVYIKFPKGKKNIITVKSGDGNRDFFIRIRSRRSGSWQIATSEGRSPEEEIDEREFWVLVDFTVDPDNPDYYIMAGNWLRRNIYEEHQKYLLLHGGIRPITPKSTHHRVVDEDIERWKDRWDILVA
jgi:hypothetical protein